jgi:hypothetical protein
VLLALVEVVVLVAELLSAALSLLDSVGRGTSDVDAVGLSPVLLFPLFAKGSLGHVFTANTCTGSICQASYCPCALRKVSDLPAR